MNPRRKKRLVVASTLILGVAAAMSLVLYALNQNIDLFYTPHEIVHGKDDTGIKPRVGQRIRVGGMVAEGSLERNTDNLDIKFNIFDTGETVTVLYNGLLPDLFREGQGIVAQGTLISARVLQATEVLAKHDETYMAPEIAEAMGKEHKKIEYTQEQLKKDG